MTSSSIPDIVDICSDCAANSEDEELLCCTSCRMRSIETTTASVPEAC